MASWSTHSSPPSKPSKNVSRLERALPQWFIGVSGLDAMLTYTALSYSTLCGVLVWLAVTLLLAMLTEAFVR